MHLDPRWKKIIGDLFSNPTRTALVVLSIFVGVFAVGLITSSQAIIVREMQTTFIEANPAHATLSVSDEDSFTDDLLQAVRNMREVGEAEGRRTYGLQAFAQGQWKSLVLVGIDDFDDIQIDQFFLQQGTWPPDDKEILLERSSLSELHVTVGDTLLVERPDGKQRRLTVTGVVYAPTEIPAQFGGSRAYGTMDTMEWLSGERTLNQLLILSAVNGDSQEHNEQVAEAVYDKVQKSGRDPSFPQVPVPNEHPLQQFIGGMVAIMSLLGILAVFLGGFLVTNTISALLAQQTRQIGIMKAVGARSSQIVQMYLVLVLCFGLVALALAYPASQVAARGFSIVIAEQFNFELRDFSVPLYIPILEAAISLLVPMLAALMPIFSGTGVTIREALSSEGGAGQYGQGIIDKIIQSVRGLPRPVLLSLRNTFRRKGRVALTLVTLTLGGAIFISIFSVRDSLLLTVDRIFVSLFDYDVQVDFERSYLDDYIITEALRIPGVVAAETWGSGGVRRVQPNGNEGETITIFAVPPDTQMMNPNITEGRWLLPEDQNAVVMSTGVMEEDTDLAVGDEVVLKLRGRDTTWQIVGVMPTIGGARWAYTSYEVFGRAQQDVGAAGVVLVRTEQRTGEFQQAVATALDEHFSRLGLNVASTTTLSTIREQQVSFFNTIIFGLLIMSMLIAVVGGLGLAGTMSLNVIERIREIGVMRAIGASDGTVLQVIMIEGLVLGILSWLLGGLLAVPISRLLSAQVGQQLFSLPLDNSFSTTGAIIWLVLSLVLASVASFLPAWRASRVTVRDVLAYE